jgi:hypothetical protein
MIDVLIWLAILAIVAIAAWYVMSQVAMPDPVRRIVMVVLVVICAIIAINILLTLTGHGGIPLRISRSP